MPARRYAPAQGDLVWLDFTPQAGHEQAGRRPALAVSPRAYNERTGLALFVPVTGQIKGYPFEVPLPDGLPVTGVALCDQVKSLDWQVRRAEFVARLPAPELQTVLGRIAALLRFTHE